MHITTADEGRVEAGAFPLANFLRFSVIDHDAWQVLRGELFALAQRGAAGIAQVVLERGDLAFQLGHRGFMRGELGFLITIKGQGSVDPVGDVVRVVFQRACAAQNAGERVVIVRRDRIKLVIMAARAADGHA